MNSELTIGAVRDRLIANGYAPCSALSPLEKRGYRVAEEPAAILCHTPDMERRVAVLIVTTKDKALREAINGVFEKLGLSRGPCRTGSDGSEFRPLRYHEWEAALTRSWSPFGAPAKEDPAVILEHAGRNWQGQELVSGILRLDGAWRGGSLLDTPRTKLQSIDRPGIEALFRALEALPTKTEPWVNPPVPRDREPSVAERNRPRFVGPRSKRDLLGNPNVLRAHMESVARGECEELPDLPPEETAAAAPEPERESLLSRMFGR